MEGLMAVVSSAKQWSAPHCNALLCIRKCEGVYSVWVVDLQETWSKAGTAVSQHKLGELAVKCLQRAGQEEKPPRG